MSDSAVKEKPEVVPPQDRKRNLNEVRLQGRLSKDPVEHVFEGGQKVVNLAVAVNRNYKDAKGEWKEKATFVEVSVRGASVQEVSQKLKKGQEVYIEGRLRQDIWKDKEEKTRSMLRIDAFKLQPVEKVKDKSAGAEIER
jgi:single-strand DNA-binding protein